MRWAGPAAVKCALARTDRTAGMLVPELIALCYGFIESVNGRLRDELLNETLFGSLPHARAELDAWRQDYNEVRPHGAIGNKVPISLQIPGGAPSPSP